QGPALTSSRSTTQPEALPSTRLFVLASPVLWPPRTPSWHRRVSASALSLRLSPRRAAKEGLSCPSAGSVPHPVPYPPGESCEGFPRGGSTVLGLRSLLPSP